jgi:hypothetical protein
VRALNVVSCSDEFPIVTTTPLAADELDGLRKRAATDGFEHEAERAFGILDRRDDVAGAEPLQLVMAIHARADRRDLSARLRGELDRELAHGA